MFRLRVLASNTLNIYRERNSVSKLDSCFKSIYVHIVTYRYYRGFLYQKVIFHDDVIIFFLG